MKRLLVLVVCAFITAEGRPSANYPIRSDSHVRPFIVGGRDAPKGRWPWFLSMEVNLKWFGGWTHVCGAFLISAQKAVTAAHCVYGRNNPADFRYKTGLSDRSGKGDQEQTIDTQKMITHPDFDNMGKGIPNDIATVHLKQAAKTNQYVKFATLPDAREDFIGAECWITGFGKIDGTTEEFPTKLQETQMTALTTADCNAKMPPKIRDVTTKHFCVFGDGERGSCQCDSGGPVQCKRAGEDWKVTGVASYGVNSIGNTCDTNYPSVYTGLSAYLEWIKDN